RGEGEPITEVVLEEDREEAEWVSDEILRRTEGPNFVPGSVALTGGNQQWKNFAVLYRSNPQSRIFEEAFRRKKIPYKIVGGMSFLDRKEIKNVLCLWRLIANHHDDASLRRIINWPARGIGKTSFEALNDFAFKNSLSLFSALAQTSVPGS